MFLESVLHNTKLWCLKRILLQWTLKLSNRHSKSTIELCIVVCLYFNLFLFTKIIVFSYMLTYTNNVSLITTITNFGIYTLIQNLFLINPFIFFLTIKCFLLWLKDHWRLSSFNLESSPVIDFSLFFYCILFFDSYFKINLTL